MKLVLVLAGAGSLAFLGAVICIVASVYPRKHIQPVGLNGTSSEDLLRPLEPEAVAQAGPLGALHGGSSYDGGNALGGLDLPSLNELGQNPALTFSRLVCTPLPLGACGGRVQADEPAPGAEEDWSRLRATADELQQVLLQQNQQILMDQKTIRELTGKLSECESGLEELPAPERSVDVWSGNRRIMAGDEVGSTAAQLQTARAVEELARAIMDLKDRIEKLEAEIGPPALNRSDSSSGATPRGRASTSPPAAASSPGPHRPTHPAKPSSKGSAVRPKGPWRVEDLEGELERKIKMLEKERQAMRLETQGPQDKMSSGRDNVSPLQHGVGEPSFPEGFVLSFPMRTNYMYGVVRREVTEMYAFTACLWLHTTEGGIGTPFSYSVPGQPNELVLLQGLHNPVELLINNKVAQLPLDLPRGQWQHVCVSWTLRDGVWKAYQGGRLKGRGEGLAAWHPIKPGGVLILGQEQDTVGGRFEASQALVGELSQFNLWDRVLKPAEVSALADCSSSALGNIAPWTDLDVDVYGGATKESTEPCNGAYKTPNPNQ
ncbi:neuronal pentraxin receptor b [Eucyclogobius newberryi]|uniref:neuronal pentraxin receptor b n=1 Tax=Eucyclogobius newberryi TaxID=166745 RepID=UPI003B5BD7B6